LIPLKPDRNMIADYDMLLRNYRGLLVRIDGFWAQVASSCPGQLACQEGCDACCRHLSLFWVEGAALGAALAQLSVDQVARIRQQARQASPAGACPLLHQGSCLLYSARPVICRTHGLPVLLSDARGARQLDYCPENFRGVANLPSGTILDLEVLNTTLATINRLFVAEFFPSTYSGPERLSIAEILLYPWPGVKIAD
jgi:uncharacterized protein